MDKKLLCQQPRILVIQDEYGLKTSFHPDLVWNGMGRSFLAEQKSIPAAQENHMGSSQLEVLAQESQESGTPFVDIDRSRKIFSAKNILRDISRRYELANQEFFLRL